MKVQSFVQELEQEARRILGDSFEKLTTFGSASDGRWRMGSDVDLVLDASRRVTLKERRSLYDVYWRLNGKYRLGLEDAHAIHPMIFIADDPVKKAVTRRLLQGGVDWRAARKAIKRLSPRQRAVRSFMHALP